VAFPKTLSDGFHKTVSDINTFTGMCTTCNPATDPKLFTVEARKQFLNPHAVAASNPAHGDLRRGAFAGTKTYP